MSIISDIYRSGWKTYVFLSLKYKQVRMLIKPYHNWTSGSIQLSIEVSRSIHVLSVFYSDRRIFKNSLNRTFRMIFFLWWRKRTESQYFHHFIFLWIIFIELIMFLFLISRLFSLFLGLFTRSFSRLLNLLSLLFTYNYLLCLVNIHLPILWLGLFILWLRLISYFRH